MTQTPEQRREYRRALAHVMAEGARGAVTVNVFVPTNTPTPARAALGSIGAIGLAGVAAAQVVYRGARGRPLLENRDFKGVEKVAIDSGTAAVTTGAVATGVSKSLTVGGRMASRAAVAAAAGTAAAEVIRSFDDVISNQEFLNDAADALRDAKEGARARLDAMAEAVARRIGRKPKPTEPPTPAPELPSESATHETTSAPGTPPGPGNDWYFDSRRGWQSNDPGEGGPPNPRSRRGGRDPYDTSPVARPDPVPRPQSLLRDLERQKAQRLAIAELNRLRVAGRPAAEKRAALDRLRATTRTHVVGVGDGFWRNRHDPRSGKPIREWVRKSAT